MWCPSEQDHVADIYVELLNQIFGSSSTSSQAFWDAHMFPVARRLFGYERDTTAKIWQNEPTAKRRLLECIQHHLSIECAAQEYNWRSAHPFQRSDLLAIHARVKWSLNKDAPYGRIISKIDDLVRAKLYAKAIKAMDFKVSHEFSLPFSLSCYFA